MGAGTAGGASCPPPPALSMAQGLEEALALLSLPSSELLWTGLTLHVLFLCWHLCPALVDVLNRGLVSCTSWHVFSTEAVSLGTVPVFVGNRLAGVCKSAFLRQQGKEDVAKMINGSGCAT